MIFQNIKKQAMINYGYQVIKKLKIFQLEIFFILQIDASVAGMDPQIVL